MAVKICITTPKFNCTEQDEDFRLQEIQVPVRVSGTREHINWELRLFHCELEEDPSLEKKTKQAMIFFFFNYYFFLLPPR